MSKLTTKQEILAEFDKIGFGNQAIIVGSKRIELRDFLSSALDKMREETLKKAEKAIPIPVRDDSLDLDLYD